MIRIRRPNGRNRYVGRWAVSICHAQENRARRVGYADRYGVVGTRPIDDAGPFQNGRTLADAL